MPAHSLLSVYSTKISLSILQTYTNNMPFICIACRLQKSQHNLAVDEGRGAGNGHRNRCFFCPIMHKKIHLCANIPVGEISYEVDRLMGRLLPVKSAPEQGIRFCFDLILSPVDPGHIMTFASHRRLLPPTCVCPISSPSYF